MDKFSEFLWRSAFALVYGWWYKTKIYGRHHVPKEGPVIISPNHRSNNDPPLCGYALPRHVNFMAKEELFRNPISKFICTWLGAFPVRRGGVDKLAIRHAMNLLKQNLMLGIFPEGTRQRGEGLGRFHDGVASMALRTGVPIVPVAIVGSDTMIRGQVAVIIGEPIHVEKAKATVEAIDGVNGIVKEAIQTMIDNYKNGAYEDQKE